MTWLQAAVLGLVEGITEFLPVSSTGHLLVAERMMGLPDNDASKAYAICIQAGAILAVGVLYTHRLKQAAMGMIGQNPDGRRLLERILVAFSPAVVAGLLLDDLVESVLFGAWPVVIAWVVGGVAILAFARNLRVTGDDLGALSNKHAFLIGLAQCVALWPGTSRSLATIAGGLLVGLSLPAAVEFSFLLGFITLSAATAFSALKHADEMFEAYGAAPIAIGFVVAFVSAVAAVRGMVAFLERGGFALFGVWRIAAGVVVAALLLAGRL